jgi:uncharacterized protein YqgC (DUF456 family)
MNKHRIVAEILCCKYWLFSGKSRNSTLADPCVMDLLYNTIAIGFLLAAVASGWVLTLLAMPGNWLMVAAAAAYALWGPETGVTQITWPTVAGLAVAAVIGEIAEFAAGLVGARRAGGSRRAALFSLLGSFAGALGGAAVGIPVPVVGSAVAAVAGGALGAFAGAAVAEYSRGERTGQSMKVGRAAFWGRLLGTGAKAAVGSLVALVVLIALVA